VSDQVRPHLKPAYLILGDDLPKVEHALKRLKARIVEESGSDANISEFDASVTAASAVVGAANTLAFLGGTRLVLVQEVQAWVKAEKEAVAAYLEAPAPDACLTLVADKLSATDPLRAATAKHGDILEYAAPKQAQLPQWLVKEAAGRLGMDLGLQEARFLVQRCGDNQHILLRELEKLQIYAGGRRVTADDVRLLGTPTYEASIFDLLDSLALGRGAAAFGAADELLAAGERIEGLFGRILRNFQNMARVAAMKEEGMRLEAIQSELKMKPYPARKLMEQAARLGSDGIARRLSVLAETDARLKGMGTLPDEVELQLCLGRLLSA
jgi:DNA polymerase-3 subunit delta